MGDEVFLWGASMLVLSSSLPLGCSEGSEVLMEPSLGALVAQGSDSPGSGPAPCLFAWILGKVEPTGCLDREPSRGGGHAACPDSHLTPRSLPS